MELDSGFLSTCVHHLQRCDVNSLISVDAEIYVHESISHFASLPWLEFLVYFMSLFMFVYKSISTFANFNCLKEFMTVCIK